jgi:8-oxo-dGTP pyrophosphatase MutT (NUDIX family)
MRHIHRDIVSALIFSKDNKLFQGKKDPKDGGVYSDAWHIPGGGIDAGENKIDALVREIKEEVGLDISKYPIELVDDTGTGQSEKVLKETGEHVLCDMTFNVYKVMLDKNADKISAQLNDDLVEYHWVDIADIPKFKMTPPSVELFTKLGYLTPDLRTYAK